MNYLTAYHTDIGIKKQTNQDALCIKTANTSLGKVALCIVCDGMGGLSKGELASAVVIKAFSQWFDTQLPSLLHSNQFSYEQLQQQWRDIVLTENRRLMNYGNSRGVKLGTTLTAFLIVKDDYYIVHVGDSRAYEIYDWVYQLTKDQTLVEREVLKGNITAEQAKKDPRRNVLLQCIGASDFVEPEFIHGKVKINCSYMLCTDGFRHEISDQEIFNYFNINVMLSEEQMRASAQYLVELDKSRMEQDNISVLLLRTF